jgi:Aerobic-type carbon monoxide dehydrogenase, large subunit CoxL/CutL homologs
LFAEIDHSSCSDPVMGCVRFRALDLTLRFLSLIGEYGNYSIQVNGKTHQVNVDRIKSQFEGGAQFSASIALKSAITLKNRQVERNNFDSYQIIRMPEPPKEIQVHITDSEAKPTGVGAPVVPPFTPALCKAIYSTVGKQIYTLPISL